jgi:hypothetical protein
MMNLGWPAASGVYGTATALHRRAVHSARDQIAHGLIDATIETHRLVLAEPDPDDQPRSRRWTG